MESRTAIDAAPSEETILGLDNIAVELPVAGLGSRALAVMLDYVVLGALVFAGMLSAGMLIAWLGVEGGWTLALMVTVYFLIDWGYFAGQEMLNRGRTLGKLAVGLRAVGRHGEDASRGSLLLRNLVRSVDVIVGVPLMAIDPLARRLGDRIAGTLVVHDQSREAAPLLGRVPPAWGAREVAVVESFLRRAPTMDPSQARILARRLVRLVERDAPEWLEGLAEADPELALRRALAVRESA